MTKVFPVEDFWYRFEWQHRGSPHIHGLLLLDDAPDCSDVDSIDEDSRTTIVDYFDSLVSAWLNHPHNVAAPCNNLYRAMLDTGCDATTVNPDVLRGLKLDKRIGEARMTARGPAREELAVTGEIELSIQYRDKAGRWRPVNLRMVFIRGLLGGMLLVRNFWHQAKAHLDIEKLGTEHQETGPVAGIANPGNEKSLPDDSHQPGVTTIISNMLNTAREAANTGPAQLVDESQCTQKVAGALIENQLGNQR